ncbi:hypothetical protein B0H14DRAFT_1704394 [Mycena olivaceomarginata]|nr:hypothetical protein B0H14DRAFT_1704394 [Mycena olivaceomarginata]
MRPACTVCLSLALRVAIICRSYLSNSIFLSLNFDANHFLPPVLSSTCPAPPSPSPRPPRRPAHTQNLRSTFATPSRHHQHAPRTTSTAVAGAACTGTESMAVGPAPATCARRRGARGRTPRTICVHWSIRPCHRSRQSRPPRPHPLPHPAQLGSGIGSRKRRGSSRVTYA